MRTPCVKREANCFILPTTAPGNLVALFDEEPIVVAEHEVALALSGPVVAAGLDVLQDLAEDPGIGGSRTADHQAVAAGLLVHANRIFRRENVAVADDGDLDGLLHLADQRPIGPAGVALRTGTSVDRDGLQPAVLGDTRHLHRNDRLVIPTGTELAR